MTDQWLTLKEAAEFFDFPLYRLQRWSRNGKLGESSRRQTSGVGRPPEVYQLYVYVWALSSANIDLPQSSPMGLRWTQKNIAEACDRSTSELSELLMPEENGTLPGDIPFWYGRTWIPWAVREGLLT